MRNCVPLYAYRSILACTAYTRYVLDVGTSEDWLALQMALAPCLLGYGAVAKMLHAHADTVRQGNVYWAWIENYNADDYTEAVRLGSGTFFYYHLVLFTVSWLTLDASPSSRRIA